MKVCSSEEREAPQGGVPEQEEMAGVMASKRRMEEKELRAEEMCRKVQ